jgi:predicted DsbA family dithiol-disulfide isomerase
VKVEVWSDVACPWCYIGKRRFDVALARFEHRDDVEVRYRSFELDPAAPAVRELAYLDHLMAKYRISMAAADQMIDTMIEAGARNGVVLRLDKAKPGNSFDAHRLLHLARERGVQAELKDKLLRAIFTKGVVIADRDVLVEVAADAGLDPPECRRVLESDAHAGDVRADEQLAADLGITSVPFFVMGGFGVAGAQPPDVLLQVLEKAWAEEV